MTKLIKQSVLVGNIIKRSGGIFLKRKYYLYVVFTLLLLIISGCGVEKTSSSVPKTNASSNTANADNKGVALNIAFNSEPTTLDSQITGNSSTKDIARNIYENLVILDDKGNPVPDLAEKIDISDDKKVYTFQIRKGVKFHNGKELTADDVEASLNRWIKLSSLGQTNFVGAKAVKKADYIVELHLAKPMVNTLALLADPIPAAAIFPKEVVDHAPDEGATEYIGTGPYKLKEWKKNQYIILERNKNYNSDGREIKKEPKLDEIKISFISDESTRISGLSSGQFDIALGISTDNTKQIESIPNVRADLTPGGFMGVFYNTKNGFLKDVTARKAVNALINSEDILKSSYGSKDYYELTSSIVTKDFPNYYSEAGKEEYNQNNPEKAKKLLKKAGYNGQELVILTSRDYQDQYNTSVVLQQELESIGVKVKLEVIDWATLASKWQKEKDWDIIPVTWAARATIFQGFWTVGGAPVEKSIKYLDKIKSASSVEEARPAIDAAQKYVWDQLPFTLIGHKKQITAVSKNVDGLGFNLGLVFYNIGIKK